MVSVSVPLEFEFGIDHQEAVSVVAGSALSLMLAPDGLYWNLLMSCHCSHAKTLRAGCPKARGCQYPGT